MPATTTTTTAAPPKKDATANAIEEGEGVEDDFNLDEELGLDIPVDPLLTLLYKRHTFTSPYTTAEEREEAKAFMLHEMIEHQMEPYLRLIQEALGWEEDLKDVDLAAMEAANAKKVAALDAAAEDARLNRGDSEVREALLAKCTHYARIGDLENCLASIEVCAKQTLAVGPRLDLIFQRIRLGIAFSDNDIAANGIRDAHRLINSSDWERRNRLKVYEGIYYIFIRDFAKSSALLLDSVTTFASGELISFKDFIFVTIIAALPVLSRAELKKRIIDSPEVISAGVDDAYGLVTAIYTCDYGSTFAALDAVCQHQRRLIYVSSHVNYFFREVRVLVFTQFLDSYSSVTLQRMASTFRLPVKVLDQMLGTIISNERITCKMDRVSDSIYTYRGDSTNFDYHRIIKNGDLLLNRIQKLSRLVDM